MRTPALKTALPSLVSLALASTALASPLEYICYSPYRNGQAPGGAEPTEAQVEEDFRILAPWVKGIRIYACQGIHAQIPKLARAAGLEVQVGAWIGKDEAANQAQVDALIALAKGGNPAITGLIVGNEVLLREDVPKARLLQYLAQVRAAGTGIPVTTADIHQRINEHRADLAPLCDYVLAHVHPFWEDQAAGNAAAHVLAAWKAVQAAYPGKRVVIGETGFPSAGQTRGVAVPGEAAQAEFTAALAVLGAREGMPFMLFSAFDEAWKGAEGPVGPNWGIWRADRSEKPAVARLRALPTRVTDRGHSPRGRAWLPADWLGVDAQGRPRAVSAGRLPVWTLAAP